MTAKKIGVWILQIVLGGFFVLAGGTKLAGSEEIVKGFQAWGFSEVFLFFIGAAEALGGFALLFPPVSTLSAMGLMVIMVGAAYTHLSNGDGISATMPATILFFLLTLLSYLRWDSLGRFLTMKKK
ncbi:MAG TPA: DoxX family protein [Nitrospiria bacterium]|jgi:uncharacterized membrane protein YphA (DoxX/SURF4 family)